MKVVINNCYGGFGLSEAGHRRYAEIKGLTLYVEPRELYGGLLGPSYYIVPPEQRVKSAEGRWHTVTLEERQAHNAAQSKEVLYARDIPRNDPALVQVVEELGGAASGNFGDLKVVDIPDGVEYQIEEYDGLEHIAETHRTWS